MRGLPATYDGKCSVVSPRLKAEPVLTGCHGDREVRQGDDRQATGSIGGISDAQALPMPGLRDGQTGAERLRCREMAEQARGSMSQYQGTRGQQRRGQPLVRMKRASAETAVDEE
jgi:hypothetical protein